MARASSIRWSDSGSRGAIEGREEFLPARLLLGVAGPERVVAEQERHDLQPPFECRIDLLQDPERRSQGGPDALVVGPFGEARSDQLPLFGEAAERQILFVAEVVEECSARDTGRGCDVLHGRVVVPLLGEQIHGGLRDERAHHGACLFAKRYG